MRSPGGPYAAIPAPVHVPLPGCLRGYEHGMQHGVCGSKWQHSTVLGSKCWRECVPGHGVDTAGGGHGRKCVLRWLRGTWPGPAWKGACLECAYRGVCGWHWGRGGTYGQRGHGEGHDCVET